MPLMNSSEPMKRLMNGFAPGSSLSRSARSIGVSNRRPSSVGLADLYDPLAMPKPLRDAHNDLDRTVDKCYRAAPFESERQRVEYLFDLYQKLRNPLTMPPKKTRRNVPSPPA